MQTITVHDTKELQDAIQAGAARILLASGEYALSKPLQFKPRPASGLILQAATTDSPPSIHSFRHLHGWTTAVISGREVWHLHLPEVAAGAANYRSLYVNRERRPRARFPKFDPKHASATTFKAVPYAEGKVPPLHHGTHRIPTQGNDIDPTWVGLDNAELVGLHFWTEERIPNLHFDPKSKTLSGSKRTVYRLTEGTQPLPFRYYIENLLDALTEPGEWCLLASSGDLYYAPKPGETPETTRVEVPTLHRLIEIDGEAYGQSKLAGDPTQQSPVQDINFSGIHFMGTDWVPHSGRNLGVDHNVPETGMPLAASVQGAFDACAAIRITAAQEIYFEHCQFSGLGSHAIRVGAGCKNISVQHCHFSEIGGSTLIAHGGDLDAAPASRTSDIYFLNNRCEGMGRTFPSACGVLGGAVRHMVIAHNLIRDTYYSAISLGWTWGYADTVSSEHLVEYNRIEEVSQGMLNDLGGIYFVGRNSGTIVRRNIIRNVEAANFGARGIYLDEGCGHFLIEQNIVSDIADSGFNMHYGHGHMLRHNCFVNCGEVGLRCSRDDGKAIFSAYHNIIVDTEHAFGTGYALANLCRSTAQSDFNLIYPGSAESAELRHPPYLDGIVPFRDWQAAGNDRNSIFADPGFVNPSQHNFQLKANSPAHALGFREWDHAQAGPVAAEALPEYGTRTRVLREEF